MLLYQNVVRVYFVVNLTFFSENTTQSDSIVTGLYKLNSISFQNFKSFEIYCRNFKRSLNVLTTNFLESQFSFKYFNNIGLVSENL